MRRATAPSRGPRGALGIEGLVVRYDGTVAVRDVHLAVTPGEWLGVIGANGAGKSSLLRALARLSPFEGVVRIDGRETASLSRRHFAQLVAYVPQKPELPAQMRAVDYVALGRLPHLGYFGAEGPHDRRRCVELLERLSLAHMSDRPLGAMSGGELQRLVLARALAQEAPVLLLDEPTSALDLGRRVEALELVDELRHERALTVVSALHDLSLAAQFADRLVLLAQGSIVAAGTPDEVLVEGSLDQHFGTRVQILRSDDGEVIVVPRRQRERTP
ncbi:MAG: ABC transporter ATP-binding protein [Acidimicrobiales bacterium]